jgi:hypothetical protein
MVVLEASATRLRVVASNHGGTSATRRGAGPEWLVEPGGVAGWQAGPTRLGDDGAADEADRQARAMYGQAFTPERSLPGLEASYRRVMDRLARRWRNTCAESRTRKAGLFHA